MLFSPKLILKLGDVLLACGYRVSNGGGEVCKLETCEVLFPTS